jgi:hypothetical protein
MRNYSATGATILTCLILVISLNSCGPKYVVRGRVVDSETQQPIQGAAVAVRWYSGVAENQSAKTGTVKAAQSVTDDQGFFKIPKYLETPHILGVYKNGYICWSSQDIFTVDPGMSGMEKHRKRKNHRINEGMEIELEQLQKRHPRDLHAGFTVMVAGESTDSELGPFHQAIQDEYQLWRENLRKDFQKQVGAK